jgi:hypothetical protein
MIAVKMDCSAPETGRKFTGDQLPLEMRWSAPLTATPPSGTDARRSRVNVQTAAEPSLTGIKGITPEMPG